MVLGLEPEKEEKRETHLNAPHERLSSYYMPLPLAIRNLFQSIKITSESLQTWLAQPRIVLAPAPFHLAHLTHPSRLYYKHPGLRRILESLPKRAPSHPTHLGHSPSLLSPPDYKLLKARAASCTPKTEPRRKERLTARPRCSSVAGDPQTRPRHHSLDYNLTAPTRTSPRAPPGDAPTCRVSAKRGLPQLSRPEPRCPKTPRGLRELILPPHGPYSSLRGLRLAPPLRGTSQLPAPKPWAGRARAYAGAGRGDSSSQSPAAQPRRHLAREGGS
ncbi:uncharacterized protein LOC119540856 [Choloepus didactylus]|uniref:uncharacterized protein LOC119540856 n=1 Tax=Choloepus didactylus TaxID=27675 RepID=UPI00189F4B8A|nr:uncharacterized protein LOC119540856 [Choloepus didactylus]